MKKFFCLLLAFVWGSSLWAAIDYTAIRNRFPELGLPAETPTTIVSVTTVEGLKSALLGNL
ncbi:MAG: hypothetical protein Q4C03_04530 [bacterium]|nr:hypothetical protein [bacterium]